jgi:hypothetical protein
MKRPTRLVATFFSLSLAACGTNVSALLEEDSRLVWQAEETVQAAEVRSLDAMAAYYQAEAEKLVHCEPLYRKAGAEIDLALHWGGRSIFDQFVGDLALLGALLIPVPEVESCARALERFRSEYAAVSDRIGR